jgi:CubicO group peptidase (beta-lactamase class C family)
MRLGCRANGALRAGARAAAIATLLACAAPAVAAPPPDLDRLVTQAMQAFGAPGLSLAIVENGRTVVAKGYGVRSIATRAPVTARTAFPIGSESKAFTTAALAMLVDEGRLKWSDRVHDRLPGFRMYDPYATENMTLTDLLTHRSGLGLGEGDLLLVPSSSRSRADVVHALRYLKPQTGFRQTFAYDNILYIAAGALLQKVAGMRWGDFVRQRILEPLRMTDATTRFQPNSAHGVALHARTDYPIRGLGPLRVLARGLDAPAADPAGGINASARDMAQWMAFWQRGGTLPDGKRLLSRKAVRALWNPVVVVPRDAFGPPGSLPHPSLQDYALGWFVEVDDGHRVIEHDGGVLGALSALYFIPGKQVAFSICINSEDVGTVRALVYELLDYYLGAPRADWVKVLRARHQRDVRRELAAMKHVPRQYLPNDRSSLPMAAYAGRYADPWYGAMTISRRAAGALWIRFDESPGMAGPLTHVADDVFEARWQDGVTPDAYLIFSVKRGRVIGIALKPVSPWTDFSFDYGDLHFTPQRRRGGGRA